MAKWEKQLRKILSGESDANIPFRDLRNVLRGLGFDERIVGSHHTYTKEDVKRPIVLQEAKGEAAAKPYQVKQVRDALQQAGVDK